MREDSLNKAARCEAMGDYQGACDALVNSSNTNVDAIRSLKKRLSTQASLRKDERGAEAQSVCMKLDEVIDKCESENTLVASNETQPWTDLAIDRPESPTCLTSPFCSIENAEAKAMGSTQKLVTFKANKEQKEQLGSELVATPVRRSCRKVSTSSNRFVAFKVSSL